MLFSATLYGLPDLKPPVPNLSVLFPKCDHVLRMLGFDCPDRLSIQTPP